MNLTPTVDDRQAEHVAEAFILLSSHAHGFSRPPRVQLPQLHVLFIAQRCLRAKIWSLFRSLLLETLRR